MSFKVKLAKWIMNLLPAQPEYDILHPRSETINHKSFIETNEENKEKILFAMAQSHYLEDQRKPFDSYFLGYDLKKLLAGKKVLDLGCWCGGKSVSYAERWNVKSMAGIDINEYFIKAARLFSRQRENKNIEYDFEVGFSEALPYEDKSFDAIVTWDVLEHVKSVRDTLKECKRVLKPGGMLFFIFPSYYCPMNGQHLDFVTRMPCLNWVFSSQTLNLAYDEIIQSRGEEAYWYKSKANETADWQKLHGGIGVNGTTFRGFKAITKEVGFTQINILPTPIFSVGDLSIHYPWIKYLAKTLKPLLKIEALQDYLSHRIVSILVV